MSEVGQLLNIVIRVQQLLLLLLANGEFHTCNWCMFGHLPKTLCVIYDVNNDDAVVVVVPSIFNVCCAVVLCKFSDLCAFYNF